ncbi:MAG TPA: MarR family transcriptional regulator [Opitutaceae bacterium]|nr:MarR family transcriptional regulator [Opitutaceae bacterium]
MASRPASSRRRLTRADYQTLAAFRHALRHFLDFSAAAARDARLTPQQHQALLAIAGFPGREPPTVGDLAQRLCLRPHSAVGLIDRLARRGLLQRQAAREDRRRVQLRLTARGAALLARLSAAHREELRRLGPELGRILEKIAAR